VSRSFAALEPFYTGRQVYAKVLPTGEPIRLTHDDLMKMSPAFSPDGSGICAPLQIEG